MNHRIGAVAKLLGVSVQSIRSWESKGLIPSANKTPTGQRWYSEKDVQYICDWLSIRTKMKNN